MYNNFEEKCSLLYAKYSRGSRQLHLELIRQIYFKLFWYSGSFSPKVFKVPKWTQTVLLRAEFCLKYEIGHNRIQQFRLILNVNFTTVAKFTWKKIWYKVCVLIILVCLGSFYTLIFFKFSIQWRFLYTHQDKLYVA